MRCVEPTLDLAEPLEQEECSWTLGESIIGWTLHGMISLCRDGRDFIRTTLTIFCCLLQCTRSITTG